MRYVIICHAPYGSRPPACLVGCPLVNICALPAKFVGKCKQLSICANNYGVFVASCCCCCCCAWYIWREIDKNKKRKTRERHNERMENAKWREKSGKPSEWKWILFDGKFCQLCCKSEEGRGEEREGKEEVEAKIASCHPQCPLI